MFIRAGYDIAFEAEKPTPMLASLSVHPSRNKDLRTAQRITTQPELALYDYVDGFGNICTRLTIPRGLTTLSCGFVIEDSFEPDAYAPDARQAKIEDLPDEVMLYLLGSRYCETDRLSEAAWSLFGGLPTGWPLVQGHCRLCARASGLRLYAGACHQDRLGCLSTSVRASAAISRIWLLLCAGA